MKKNLKYYMIFIVFLFVFIQNVSASNKIIFKELEYTDEFKNYLNLSQKEKRNLQMPKMHKSNIKYSLDKISEEAYLSKYDLRDLNYVTSMKNQQNSSLCWGFSTCASLESNVLKKGIYKDIDLSETHIELATQSTYPVDGFYINRPFNIGGNYFVSSLYLLNGWGAISENDMSNDYLFKMINNPPDKYDTSKLFNYKKKVEVDSISMLFSNPDKACGFDNDINIKMKNYIVNNGGLATSINVDHESVTKPVCIENDTEFNCTVSNDSLNHQYYKYSGSSLNTNHAVTIVGWDDTVDPSNFPETSRPSKPGAWIVKNSWGEKSLISHKNNKPVYVLNGDKGYFYISYEDPFVCRLSFGFKAEDSNMNDNIYASDASGFTTLIGNTLPYYYLAFKNTKKSDSNYKEKLNKIITYNEEPGTKYELYLSHGNTVNFSESIKIAEGEFNDSGYVKIPIEKDVYINGDYVIYLKVYAYNGRNILAISSNLAGEIFKDSVVYRNTTFLSDNGQDWMDTFESNKKFNTIFRVFTENVEITEPNTTTKTSIPNTTKITTMNKTTTKKDNDDVKEEIEIIPNDDSILTDDSKDKKEKNPSTSDKNINTLVFITISLISIIIIASFKIKRKN